MTSLHGRQALVTGSSRGIGRAVALALAAAGAHVHAISRNAEGLQALLDAHQAAGGNGVGTITAHPCEVGDPDVLKEELDLVLGQSHGVIDILVSNAGVFSMATLTATAPDDLAATLDANVVLPFRVLHTLLGPMLKAGRGHVVTIGSVADRRIFPGNGAYAASKFGARAMHEVLREETAGTGIRTTLVSPSATDTPIWDPIDPDNTPGLPPRSAMLRPEDVADAVLWAVTRPAHVNIEEVRLGRA